MIKRLLPSGELFRNISTLVVGTFIAQLVPVLLQSVLRRLYPAEDFGVFAVFISLTGMLMVVATLRYEVAIVLPEKNSDAANLTLASFGFSLVFSFLLLIILVFFLEPVGQFLNIPPESYFMLWYVPAAVWLFSTYQVINYYLVREKDYRGISVNKISRRVAEGAVQTGLGFSTMLSTGLIWGNIVGHLANVVTGYVQMVRKGFSIQAFSMVRIRQLLVTYREYPFFNLLPTFLNALCINLPLVFVNKFYSAQTTAYFDLARQVLVLPASILILSISQVLLQVASEKIRNRERLTPDAVRITLFLGFLAAGMAIIMLLWAPWLFALYAGESYAQSGFFAQIIVGGAALKLIVSPLSSVFPPLGKIRWLSLWQTIYFLAILGLLLFRNSNIETFLTAYLVVDLISYGSLMALTWYSIWKYERRIKNEE